MSAYRQPTKTTSERARPPHRGSAEYNVIHEDKIPPSCQPYPTSYHQNICKDRHATRLEQPRSSDSIGKAPSPLCLLGRLLDIALASTCSSGSLGLRGSFGLCGSGSGYGSCSLRRGPALYGRIGLCGRLALRAGLDTDQLLLLLLFLHLLVLDLRLRLRFTINLPPDVDIGQTGHLHTYVGRVTREVHVVEVLNGLPHARVAIHVLNLTQSHLQGLHVGIFAQHVDAQLGAGLDERVQEGPRYQAPPPGLLDKARDVGLDAGELC